MPLIFGLISDVALLLLPITAILKLQISSKKKLGLAGIFSVGVMYVVTLPAIPSHCETVSKLLMLPSRFNVYSACLLELARIIELEVDTDDQLDPSCKRVSVIYFSRNRVAGKLTMINSRRRGDLPYSLGSRRSVCDRMRQSSRCDPSTFPGIQKVLLHSEIIRSHFLHKARVDASVPKYEQ